VAEITSRAKESLRDKVEVCIFNSRDESVLGVVAVLLSSVARNAEVVILARCAGNEVLLREFCRFVSYNFLSSVSCFRLTLDAAVASTSGHCLLLWLNKSCLRPRSNWLWCNGLGSAVDNLAALDKSLDHPVIITLAKNSLIDASLAEIEITIVTGAAVVVLIWDRLAAVVAVDREDAHSWDGSCGIGVVA